MHPSARRSSGHQGQAPSADFHWCSVTRRRLQEPPGATGTTGQTTQPHQSSTDRRKTPLKESRTMGTSVLLPLLLHAAFNNMKESSLRRTVDINDDQVDQVLFASYLAIKCNSIFSMPPAVHNLSTPAYHSSFHGRVQRPIAKA